MLAKSKGWITLLVQSPFYGWVPPSFYNEGAPAVKQSAVATHAAAAASIMLVSMLDLGWRNHDNSTASPVKRPPQQLYTHIYIYMYMCLLTVYIFAKQKHCEFINGLLKIYSDRLRPTIICPHLLLDLVG